MTDERTLPGPAPHFRTIWNVLVAALLPRMLLFSATTARTTGDATMSLRLILLATATVLLASAKHAKAEVQYTVYNPHAAPYPFILLIYDSPTFITTDTTVYAPDTMPGAPELTFANPANAITSVEFKPSSNGVAEVDVFQSGNAQPQTFAGDQFRYYPLGTLGQYGVTAGIDNLNGAPSFGAPNSLLSVTVPEPGTLGLLAASLIGLLGVRRRMRDRSVPKLWRLSRLVCLSERSSPYGAIEGRHCS